MQKLNKKNFTIAAIITSILAVIILSASFSMGKNNLFLLLNADLGKVADFFFHWWTYAGDGAVWVLVLIYILVKKKTRLFPLVFSAFALSTIFTQICKYVIVPDEPRPILAIKETALIHTVPGVELHEVSSFPSGHTATAFTLYLLFALICSGNAWLVIGLLYALLVGYSRIYLAQHFPLDVGAGMVTAVLSVWLAMLIQDRWKFKNK
ncbi:MAG: phosphatase PAP2 family protein [Filimonas sp.]|nr:phosphatase PAP2 family protein [Filimonas sp.]